MEAAACNRHLPVSACLREAVCQGCSPERGLPAVLESVADRGEGAFELVVRPPQLVARCGSLPLAL